MLRPNHVALIGTLILILVPLCSQAQDKEPSSTPGAISARVSKNVLIANGFTFADEPLPMCKISGPDGPCRVEAFAHGEIREDEARFTCAKLDRATYVGHCTKGKLDGFALVTADGSKKHFKEAYLSYFYEGHIAYPALTSFLAGDNNLGVDAKGMSSGCVYFGKWDRTSERCALFTQIYGKDFFTESTAQKLRDGTFDFDKYRAKFLAFMQQKH